MIQDPSFNETQLPPKVVQEIDKAISSLEQKIPGITGDRQVRDQVETAVRAALVSLDHVVPWATEAETRRAMEKTLKPNEDPSLLENRKILEKALNPTKDKASEEPLEKKIREAMEKIYAMSEEATKTKTQEDMEKLGRAAIEQEK